MSESECKPAPLFRHRPVPACRVFDVHVNALPPGMAAPRSFYAAMPAESLTDDSPPAAVSATMVAGDAAEFVGGCVTPPAGLPLHTASLALRQWSAGTTAWHTLLRLDPASSHRPRTIAHTLRAPAAALKAMTARRSMARRSRSHQHDDDIELDGFAGIKLMPQATGLPSPAMLKRIAEHHLPVLVHAGILCPPRWLEQHLLPHLTGPVIFAHLGSWPCAADDLAYAVAMAREDQRVYLETSGASIGNFVRHAAEQVPHKVLFGSNRPMCEVSVQWNHVASAIEDDETLDAIGYDNAARVFGLEQTPASPDGVSTVTGVQS